MVAFPLVELAFVQFLETRKCVLFLQALLLSQLSSDLSAKSKIKLLEVMKTSLTTIHRVLMKVPELATVVKHFIVTFLSC